MMTIWLQKRLRSGGQPRQPSALTRHWRRKPDRRGYTPGDEGAVSRHPVSASVVPGRLHRIQNLLHSGWFASVLTAAVLPGHATADQSMVAVALSVTLLASNCQINNNLPVEASFESVPVNKLSQKTVSVPISIACDGDAVPVTLMMAVKADPAPFNADALGTGIGGLGITLSSPKAEKLHLNTFYDVRKTFGLTSGTGTFNLTAHLVSDDKVKLAGGDFSASATLVLQAN